MQKERTGPGSEDSCEAEISIDFPSVMHQALERIRDPTHIILILYSRGPEGTKVGELSQAILCSRGN